MKVASVSLSRLESDLQMAGKAPTTIQQYLSSIRGFEAFLGREPHTVAPDELRAWAQHLRCQSIGAARLRCHYSALTFLYRKTLGQPEKVAFISMPRSEAPLPIVLTPQEVKAVLECFTTAKYRAFFTLIYATGLRIREAASLVTRDLDVQSQVIRIQHGKGGKPRLVPLSRRLVQILRTYWSHERPTPPWLFATAKDRPLCHATARMALLKASAVSGIGKVVTPHMLRHAFATHLLEQGVDLRRIQVILGHGSIRSTTIYTQVSAKEIGSVRSPLEDLNL